MNNDDNGRPGRAHGRGPNQPPNGSGGKQRPSRDGGYDRPRKSPGSGGYPHAPQHHGPIIDPIHIPNRQGAKNERFLRAILNDYSSQDVSELGAILLYLYESIMLEPREKQLAKGLLEVAEDEMRHFRILGEMIVGLGGNPEYRGEQSGSYFNAGKIIYPKTIKDMLQINIKAETVTIQNYSQHMRMSPTQEIAETIQKLIDDEKRHLAFFKNQYQRLFGR